MRILAFNWRCLEHPQSSGSELNLFEQARRWVKAGHHVTIVTADPGREHIALQEDMVDGIHVYRRGGRFSVYLHAALFAWRRSREFDYILDMANGIPFFTPLTCAKPGVLLVHHVHDQQWYSEFPKPIAAIGRFIERKIVPFLYRQSRVIAVSPTTRDALLGIGFTFEQIEVIYNGISGRPSDEKSATSENTQDTQETEVLTSRQPRIAYIGRLKRYKRIELLVRAVAELRHKFPDLHLDIAGDGDARPQIESLIEELALQQYVTLHGFVNEETKTAILQSATVFATPSMHEGWGLSVLEANVFGCPAVAYDVPGLQVAIRHEETGLLATSDSDFHLALTKILQDAALRAHLSAGAQRWASRFSWDASAEATLRVLQSAGASPSAQLQLQGDW